MNPFQEEVLSSKEMIAAGWLPWRGGVCPVAATTRVEVVTADPDEMRQHARGLALAFHWVLKDGPKAVHFWRLERPVIR